jgi:iron complex outermembrane receptor protein
MSENKVINFTEFIDDYDNGGQQQINYTKTNIAFSPSMILGGRLSLFPLRGHVSKTIENLSIDLLPKYVSRQFLDNTSNVNRSINPFFVTDVIVNYPLRLKAKSILNLRTGLYNIFNAQYEANGYTFSYLFNQNLTTQNYYFPQTGFRWMLGMGIDL